MDVIQQYLLSLNWSLPLVNIVNAAAGFLILIIAGYIIHLINKYVFIKIIIRITKSTYYGWDDIMLAEKVFHRGLYLLPAIAFKWLIPVVFHTNAKLMGIANVALNIYFIVIGIAVIDALLNSVITGYRRFDFARKMPIKGVIQAIKIFVVCVAIILILSVVLKQNPTYFLAGLGTATAVLLLIFKDAILGLVSGIQLAANNMVQTGDWIEVPQHGADGEVIDVALTTVKVQNWDKTIVSVPAYDLISSSFKNWRGMEESRGRRIKRSIFIDINTIKFLDSELTAKLKKMSLVKEYINQKEDEISCYNKKYNIDPEKDPVNARRLTNIGTFRIYCEKYLKQHSKIHNDLTHMVRQLNPQSKGLPLEIYCFVTDIKWENYEKIQSDIFDHLFAVLPFFGLKSYQEPAGSDVRALTGNSK
jgi:miniconductance mechanosensitive channel